MGFFDLILLAIALSMDAFAVSVCKGLAMDKVSVGKCTVVGIWFGGFQALMPLIGWSLASLFEKQIMAFDHWIALVLLVIIGVNMIREACTDEEERVSNSLGIKTMFVMAVATSIDALATGITFVGMSFVRVVAAVLLIGVTTFAFSAVGVKLGNVFGMRFKSKAEILGGIILICLGVKIFTEHMGWIDFPV